MKFSFIHLIYPKPLNHSHILTMLFGTVQTGAFMSGGTFLFFIVAW